ncbi:MAG: molybdate ABC transporter substrate-binding protein, partial [Nitrospinota bacterium]
MRVRWALGVLLFALCAGGVSGTAAPPGGPATILVAASTRDAVEEIAKRFRERTGTPVRVVPGPSSGLAAQILAGAPADVFLSANRAWAEKVRAEGLALEMLPLLGNDLVIVVPKGNPARVKAPADLTGIRVKRVALAGEKVPAGIYADQALQSLGLRERLVAEKKIVRGQDVRMALTFVERGEAEAGIVYATDAKISREVETAYVFPASAYQDKIVY